MYNPAKLRKLSLRIGHDVVRAYARWFDNQTTLLVFTDTVTAYVVPRIGDVTLYTDEAVELVDNGVRTRMLSV